MAKSKIPSPLERRHLIERELSAEQALGLADAYLEQGRVEEAVVFLGKAGADERLDALLQEAVSHGDVFLVQSISRELGTTVPASTWEEVAEHARAAGKDLYAEAAERQAHRSAD